MVLSPFRRLDYAIRNHGMVGRYAFYASAARRGEVRLRVQCALVGETPHDEPRVLTPVGACADDGLYPRLHHAKGAAPQPAPVVLLVDAREHPRPLVAASVVLLHALGRLLEPRARLGNAVDLALALLALLGGHPGEQARATSVAGERLDHATPANLDLTGCFGLHST